MALKITVSAADAKSQAVGVLGVPVGHRQLESDAFVAALDEQVDGALRELAVQAKFDGALGQTLEVATLGRLAPRRLVLVGVGAEAEQGPAGLRRYVATVARIAVDRNATTAAALVPGIAVDDKWRVAAEGVVLGAYRFNKYLTGERRPKAQLKSFSLHKVGRVGARERAAVALGVQVGEAVCDARDAVNEPPNSMTPAALASMAKQVARDGGLRVKVLDKRGIARAGMALHSAVGQGSANEPHFIHVSYVPKGRRQQRLAFVGKGLTFDSGGLCIKPAAGMWEMKSDMGGAAAVLGLMRAVAAVQPRVEVHGIIGAAENMPDGNAYRPGDVLGSLDGKTVEVINTDAEGRLVLADALCYARRLKPDLLVDAATLTGACVVALGKTYSAYYTADDDLAGRMDEAARYAGDGFWRMPLIDELREQLKSDVADLKHTGDRWGGSITAALFLREFVGDTRWMHCDIAGPVLADQAKAGQPKGATGHPVLTFLRIVEAFG